jgi:prephenate dehydrogenase
MANVNVTVVGLGRLGASFGLAVRALNGKPEHKHTFSVTGFDSVSSLLRAAKKIGAIDQEASHLDEAVAEANLVFLAVPYAHTEDVLSIIGPALPPGAVVMDASPLKQPSLAWADKHLPHDDEGNPSAYLIGVTPVVNPLYMGESAGEAGEARADLFENGVMLIAPALSCPQEAVRLVSDICTLLDIKQHFVDPAEFDGMIAGMDGLPLVIQLALFKSLSQSKAWSDMQWLGNTAFFLATYRLMDHDAMTAARTLARNQPNVLHKLDRLIESLAELRATLASGDEELLAEHFDTAMGEYEDWQEARVKNRYSTEPAPVEEVRPTVQLLGGLRDLIPGAKGKKSKK